MTGTRQFVFKVVTRAAWNDACRQGAFAGSADDARDGFIHLSTREQLAGTLAKHFRGQDGLVLIQIETQLLGEQLRWEESRGGDKFPHLYTALPTDIACAVHALALGPDGAPMLPKELAAC
jgi:uncharacterized protein (DUF952 family)